MAAELQVTMILSFILYTSGISFRQSDAIKALDSCALVPQNTVIIKKTINLERLTETAHGIQDLLLGIKHIQRGTEKKFVLHHNLIKTILQQTSKNLQNTVNHICHITQNQELPLTKVIKERVAANGLSKLTEKIRKNKRLFKYKRNIERYKRDMSFIIPGITPTDTRSELVNQLTNVIHSLQTEIKNNSALLEAVDHTVVFMAAALVAQNEAKLLNKEISEVTSNNSNLYPHLKNEIKKVAQFFTHSSFRANTLEEKNRLYTQIYKNAKVEVTKKMQILHQTETNLCENTQILISLQAVTPKPDSACFTHIKENKYASESNNLYAFSHQHQNTYYMLGNDRSVTILDPQSTIVTTQSIALVWSAPARWIVTEVTNGITLTCINSNNTKQVAKIFQGTILETTHCEKITSKQLSFQAVHIKQLGNTTDKLLESASKEISQFTHRYMERRLKTLGNSKSIDESIRSHLKQAARAEDRLRERVEDIEETNWLSSLTNKIKVTFALTAAAAVATLTLYLIISLALRCRRRKARKRQKEEQEQNNIKLENLEKSVNSLSSFLEMGNKN